MPGLHRRAATRRRPRKRRRRRRHPLAAAGVQLIRQPGPITDRTFEITFPDPGAQAYCFTFGLTGAKHAVEADLDGLFFAFTIANLAGRVLAYVCGSEAQAVALMDKLINGLVWERAQAAA